MRRYFNEIQGEENPVVSSLEGSEVEQKYDVTNVQLTRNIKYLEEI